jgi:hypothetical protein
LVHLKDNPKWIVYQELNMKSKKAIARGRFKNNKA